MLREWQDRLKQLVTDPERSFHLMLRVRIGKKATPVFEKRIKQYILSTPAIVSRILEMGSSAGADRELRELGRRMLEYLCDPNDLISERQYGLYGCLDDAYLVALVYLRALELRGQPRLLTEDEKSRREFSRRFVRDAVTVLPEEAGRIIRKQARVALRTLKAPGRQSEVYAYSKEKS